MAATNLQNGMTPQCLDIEKRVVIGAMLVDEKRN
jgi:hypothetical protein